MAVWAAPSSATHTSFQGAGVKVQQVASAPDGRPRVRISWNVRCSGADALHGVVALYSYKHRRVVSTPVFGLSLPLAGSMVTAKTAGPGRYRPQLTGPACFQSRSGPGSPPLVSENEEPHLATGPRIVRGPDFVICRTSPAGASSSGTDWPLIPVNRDGPCASPDPCKAGGSTSSAWPVIPVPGDCRPRCRSRAGASSAWPVIPSRERCAPERLRNRKAPIPVDCPGGGSTSSAWPVVPSRGPCGGRMKLETAAESECHSAQATSWPVVPCRLLSARWVPIGVSKFRMRPGTTGIVPVRVRPFAQRSARRLGSIPARATIVIRKGGTRVRTVRTFRLVGR